MNVRKTAAVLSLLAAFAAGYFAGTQDDRSGVAYAQAQGNARVFELRTYTAHPGRLDEVVARFRDNTARIFAKNGITSVGYFTPQDAPLAMPEEEEEGVQPYPKGGRYPETQDARGSQRRGQRAMEEEGWVPQQEAAAWSKDEPRRASGLVRRVLRVEEGVEGRLRVDDDLLVTGQVHDEVWPQSACIANHRRLFGEVAVLQHPSELDDTA